MKITQYHLDPENGYMICATNNGWLYPFPYSAGLNMLLSSEEHFNSVIIDAINRHINKEEPAVIARTGSIGKWKAISEFLPDEYEDPHPYIGKSWEEVLSTLEISEASS